MGKNKRLEELIQKYKDDSLTKSEFQEFIGMLHNPGNLEVLDDFLTAYWHKMPQDQLSEDPVLSKKPVHSRVKENPGIFAKWNIAASFLILMAAAVFYLVTRSPGEAFTNYKTDFSEILDVELPDGSMVTLNANSKLTWDNQWKKKGARWVMLDGEAFFDIKNLENEMTFTVETGEVSVEVVGTSFNVDSRNQKVEVYLDEGKVNLRMDHDLTNIITLEPGQKVKFDAAQKKIEKTMNESMISSASWKKGVLNFKDMEFREVLDKLKNIYGKSFTCEEEDLLSKKIYLGVPYSDWEAVRQALELSLDIQLKESENMIKITSN